MPYESTTEKAAKIRADIQAALKAGTLGAVPEGLKVSVRTEYASLMSAVNVTLKGVSEKDWALTAQAEDRGYPTRRVSPEAADLADKLMGIVHRHFTPDGRSHFADVSLDTGLLLASE